MHGQLHPFDLYTCCTRRQEIDWFSSKALQFSPSIIIPQMLHTHSSIIREIGKGPIRGHISTNEYSHPTTRIKSVITTSLNCRYIFSVEVADHGCWTPMYPGGLSLKNESGFRKHRIRSNTDILCQDATWSNKFELVPNEHVINDCRQLPLY
jgi:hypothetical protein